MQDTGKFSPVASDFGSTKVEAHWMYGFSAYLDPQREEVRFLFDAREEIAHAIDKVVAMRWVTDGSKKDVVELSDCRLELISDPTGKRLQYEAEPQTNFLEGWQLTCPKVHHHFQQGVLIYNKTKYASFDIEVLKTDNRGMLGACVGPLYTQRQVIKPFILYNSRLGIEHFDIYHVHIRDFSAGPMTLGIWDSDELKLHKPLDLLHHANVTWHSYEAPLLRYYHGQTTALNDCLVRNRYLFTFVVISDPDEVIRIIQGQSMDLGAMLTKQFPLTHGSLSIPRYSFPVPCCHHESRDATRDTEEAAQEFFDSCKLHTAKDHDLGKSVVRPQLVEAVTQHSALLFCSGVQERIEVAPEIAHMVHVKFSAAWNFPFDCEHAHMEFSEQLDFF